VVLKGVLEEVGSLVVVLRLWRVFKVGFHAERKTQVMAEHSLAA